MAQVVRLVREYTVVLFLNLKVIIKFAIHASQTVVPPSQGRINTGLELQRAIWGTSLDMRVYSY